MVLCLLFFVRSLYAQQGARELKPNVAYTHTLRITGKQNDFFTHYINIPPEIFAVRISLSNAPVDLDLFVKHGSQITDYQQVDVAGTSEEYNEQVFFSRFSHTSLQTGIYYIDTVYQRSEIPVIEGQRRHLVYFTIKAEMLKGGVAGEVSPGTPVRSQLKPEEGMFKIFSLNVPVDTPVFRVDIFDTHSDVDLLINHGSVAASWEDADYTSETFLAREQLVVKGRDGGLGVAPGTYFITVIDQLSDHRAAPFSILTSLSSEPPSILKTLPIFPERRSAMDNSLLSTVEISGKTSGGSGCLVSRSGLILTNWHVVRNHAGMPSKRITVAMNFSYTVPPEEVFKAVVVDFDEEKDIALLQIASGLYDSPIPESYTFPHFTLGNPETVTIGDQVGLIGFPEIGGTGSRVSVTYTNGIVSGFEDTLHGTLIKTDGQIGSGSSGGAAVDSSHTLIGIPTVIIRKNAGSIGFISPVTMLPSTWLDMIHQSDR